jgi:hypothetical protein
MAARRNTNRARGNFSRREQTRPQLTTILIVCEDSVLTPDYFRAMKKDLGLTSVEIVGGDKAYNEPEYIVEYAKKRLKEASGGIEKAYCVFDGEGKADNSRARRYKNAIHSINTSETKGIVDASSQPCFEIWILLHFIMTTAEFKDCSEVEKAIKGHLKMYSKKTFTGEELYFKFKDKTSIAIKNAKSLKAQNKSNDSANPATNIHLLVEELLNISKK